MADKSLILADLRSKPYGKGAVLYSADIAEELKKSPGAIYKLLEKGGLGVRVLQVGGRPAINVHEWVDFLAGEATPAPKEDNEPETAAPALPKPKWKVNKDIAKAMSLLRGQREFYTQVEAELERLETFEASEDDEGDGEGAKTPPKKGLADRTDIL